MAHGKIFGSSYIRMHYCINNNCVNEVSSSKKDGKVIYNQYCYDCQKKSDNETKATKPARKAPKTPIFSPYLAFNP